MSNGAKESRVSASCPFCRVPPERVDLESDLALSLRDAFPLTDGHTLVVTRRHVADYFALSTEEQVALWGLVNEAQRRLGADPEVVGFNLGVNVGAAAGQTVPHVHVHIIPRRSGDRPDPRGGVRWIFPERAAYWEADR